MTYYKLSKCNIIEIQSSLSYSTYMTFFHLFEKNKVSNIYTFVDYSSCKIPVLVLIQPSNNSVLY